QWENSLTAYVYPIIGDLPVQVVDVALVMKVLEPIWTSKPETASRTRGRIERILDWATASGYRTGENPARWRGHLDNLLPARRKVRRIQHHPSLAYSEIGRFVADLRQRDGIAPRGMEFLVLTAARTNEVIGAQWSEIDLAGRAWII